MATLETLYSFTGANSDGAQPYTGLIMDAQGDLFGTTESGGGTGDDGTVFEIPYTNGSYATTPIVLATFTVANGFSFQAGAGLFFDASGNLLGTTQGGGANGQGTVFEIPNDNGTFGPLETLVNFDPGSSGQGPYQPYGGLIADQSGNLIGTTYFGGAHGDGAVFEIPYSNGVYASAPQTLVSFDYEPSQMIFGGAEPEGALVADAAGDLFGTTALGGTDNDGTVFAILYNNGSYGAPITLASFTGLDANGTTPGESPMGAVVFDKAGDLFGTTYGGGSGFGNGTVFEIPYSVGSGFGPLKTLVEFNNTDGATPFGALLVDAAGNLFGTTSSGGAHGFGTIFEIPYSNGSYASAPTTLISFTGQSTPDYGNLSRSTLIVDSAGNLYGTTDTGGTDNDGTVFEVTDSGFQVARPAAARDFDGDGKSDVLFRNTNGNLAMWLMNGATVAASSIFAFADPSVWSVKGTGDFDGNGTADILWQDSSGDVSVWDMNGFSLVGSALAGFADPSAWSIEATGDFNGDGKSDILWRSTSGNVDIWEMNGTSIAASAIVGFADPAAWDIKGTGDFNGDGKSDILWQDTSGNVDIWEMNGTSVAASGVVGFADPASWMIRGTGDFNGDGKADILWQDTSGDIAIWEMNGTSVAATAAVGFADPATWQIAGVGDYNGDGKSDILWHSSGGNVAVWEMNGFSVAASGLVGFADPSAWHFVPPDNTGSIPGTG